MESDKSAEHMEVSQIFSTSEAELDYFSCETAITRLNDYLDHELAPEERAVVKKHLEICEPCLEKFNFEQNLIASLRQRMQSIACPHVLKTKLGDLIRG
jgi:anti-sigma factor (TIGR02949 family)